MRTYVISLPSSTRRRESIRSQLDALRMDFSWFDAVDLQNDQRSYFHHCDQQEFRLTTGRWPTAGEMGCYASHLTLWKTCQRLQEPLAIFEDDAEFSPDALPGLEFAQSHIRRLGFIRLQENCKHLTMPLFRRGDQSIDYCLRFPHGSMAYVISPAVADAFIRHSRIFCAPVDCFIKDFWQHEQPLYTLAPAIVRDSPLSACSTLNARQRRGRPTIRLRLHRWSRKRMDGLRRARFNTRQLQVYWTLPKRMPELTGRLTGMLKN